MLDNVVEINGLPLEQQRDEILRKRRHGMGFLGLGSTITLLRMKYGSPESVQFTEDVSREMAVAGWEAALELAREKGPAPIMNEEFTVTEEMLRKRPEMAKRRLEARATRSPGRLLHAKYSRYMQRVAEVAPQLVRRARRDRRALHAPHLDRAHRHDLAVARQQCLERHRAVVRAPLLPQRDPRRARSPRRRSTSSPSSCWPTASSSTRSAMPSSTNAGREAAGLLHRRRRHHAEGARRHPGRGAEVGRFVDFQDGERADGLHVRELQGHLSVRPRAGPEGLHHVPLQPGGLPGRAGEGSRT